MAVIIIVSVLLLMLIANAVEMHAHKSPKEPLEDLRVSYAPDLLQVFKDQEEYERSKDRQYRQAAKDQDKERWERYTRELQDAHAKRWLEGNPVTYDNPLTEREHPIAPIRIGGRFY